MEQLGVVVLLRRVDADEAGGMPKRKAGVLNFLPAYWEPLFHWSVNLVHFGLAATTSISDSMAASAVVSMLNR